MRSTTSAVLTFAVTAAAVLSTAVLSDAFLVAAPLAAQGVGPAVGTPGPIAALEDLDGNAVSLADYIEAGKPTVLEFWATWCEQCEALQPTLDRIQEHHGADVNIVAVAVGVNQNPRRVKRHLEDHDPGYPYLWDGKGAAVRAYKAPTTAVVVILDKEGKVAYSGVGPDQPLMAEIGKLLGHH